MATEGSKIAIVAAGIENSAFAVAKLDAGALTGPSAMLSNDSHPVADTGKRVVPKAQNPYGDRELTRG